MWVVKTNLHAASERSSVAASELAKWLVMRPLRNTERVQIKAGVGRLLAKEREPGVTYKGEMDASAWGGGRVAGRNHDDVPTVVELLDQAMAHTAEISQVSAASTLTMPAAHSPRATTA